MARRPATSEMPPQGVPEKARAASTMVVRFPHGFLEADGTHRVWLAGQVVDEADELELLRSRGVELQER